MKKLAGLFLTAALVFGMTTVAFAAPSKSTTVTDGKTPEGATVSHTLDEKKATEAGITKNKEGKVAISDEKMKEIVVAITDAKIAKDVTADKIQITDVFDVQAPANYTSGKPVDITIPGVTYQEGIVVLHFENGKWVALPTKKGNNNTVVATFTSFSPTAIALVKTSANAGEGTAQSASGKSPKTAEANTVLYVALLALAAGATAYATKRKFA